MLVRTSFRFVMERLFLGNDKVLPGVEADDELVLWYSKGGFVQCEAFDGAPVRRVPDLKQHVVGWGVSLA